MFYHNRFFCIMPPKTRGLWQHLKNSFDFAPGSRVLDNMRQGDIKKRIMRPAIDGGLVVA